MPHVNIKYFAESIDPERERELVAALTDAVTGTVGCSEGVVSVALEPIAQESWQERVYLPEILGRKDLLRKSPDY